jgi:hypothetical protein
MTGRGRSRTVGAGALLAVALTAAICASFARPAGQPDAAVPLVPVQPSGGTSRHPVIELMPVITRLPGTANVPLPNTVTPTDPAP